MKNIIGIIILLFIPSITFAIETAPRITDREIVERLARLEEGQRGMEKSLRAEIRANADAIKQMREDMNAQFDRITHIMLGILGAFVMLFGGTIWFALWDRRTMIRPFETKVKEIEGEIAENRTKLHALIDSFRTLSKTDEKS